MPDDFFGSCFSSFFLITLGLFPIISLINKKDKEIIGGFNLKIGDRMIDCTVSNKLKNLRKKLINN